MSRGVTRSEVLGTALQLPASDSSLRFSATTLGDLEPDRFGRQAFGYEYPEASQEVNIERQAFVWNVAADIGRSEQKRWCSRYFRELLVDGDRKSID